MPTSLKNQSFPNLGVRIAGGRTHYGEAIGILTLDTLFPRIVGDVGNAKTYNFPVKFKTVRRATVSRVLKREKALLKPFVEAAKELEKDGINAITTSCGFLSPFQDALAKEIRVPVFTSTLMLLPLVHRMLGRGQKVGIITADSSSLTPRHFEGVGAADVPIAIEGLQNTTAFANCFLKNGTSFDPEAVEKEVVDAAKRLSKTNKDIGAIVFECANLAPYSESVHREVGLPVFDIVTFINMIHDSIEMTDRFGSKIL